MKRKITALALLVCIMWSTCAFAGCRKEKDERLHTNPVDNGTWCYGNYIYFDNDGAALPVSATSCKLARYNIKTGRVSAACTDSQCEHTREDGCPFADFSSLEHIENGKIYYYTVSLENDSYLMVYDIERESASIVMNCSEMECGGDFMFCEGKLYFIRSLPKEGAQADSPEDYTRTLCQWRSGNGEYDILFEIPVTYRMVGAYPEMTEFLFVANTRCYFLDGETGNIYHTDMTGADRQWITDFEIPFMLASGSRYENTVYFYGGDGTDVYEYSFPSFDGSEQITQEFSRASLYALNLEDNTFVKVIDNMAAYTIADGKIYYTSWGYRFYGYDEVEGPVRNFNQSEFYRADLDGSNVEVVLSDFYLLGDHFAASGDTLFGIFRTYSQAGRSKYRYAVINARNGKIEYLDTPEDDPRYE